MGLFDKLKSNELKLTPKAALALAAVTVIASDGSVEDDEINQLTRLVKGDEQALSSALAAYEKLSVADSVRLAAKALDGKQRMACIAILLDLAMSDGILAGAEQELLNAYVEAFQLAEADITGIVDVIALKNDFSVF